MGRRGCCEKIGLNRGKWSAEEDEKLIRYINANGEGSWRSLPTNAGLLRCGKSCRLRWINYLRADVKRGKFSEKEEATIVKMHNTLGNRWSLIAGHLPGRTDNEIKNYWNSHLKRKIYRYRFIGESPLSKEDMTKMHMVKKTKQRASKNAAAAGVPEPEHGPSPSTAEQALSSDCLPVANAVLLPDVEAANLSHDDSISSWCDALSMEEWLDDAQEMEMLGPLDDEILMHLKYFLEDDETEVEAEAQHCDKDAGIMMKTDVDNRVLEPAAANLYDAYACSSPYKYFRDDVQQYWEWEWDANDDHINLWSTHEEEQHTLLWPC